MPDFKKRKTKNGWKISLFEKKIENLRCSKLQNSIYYYFNDCS